MQGEHTDSNSFVQVGYVRLDEHDQARPARATPDT